MSADTKPIHIDLFKEAIKDLSDENLHSIKDQLTNSVEKLCETNSLLEHEISATTDEEELKLYKETVQENQEVIASQNERLELLSAELNKRGHNEGVYL